MNKIKDMPKYETFHDSQSLVSGIHDTVECTVGFFARSSSGHFDKTPPPMNLVKVESRLRLQDIAFHRILMLEAHLKSSLTALYTLYFYPQGIKQLFMRHTSTTHGYNWANSATQNSDCQLTLRA